MGQAQKAEEVESNEGNKGHNIEKHNEFIRQCAFEMADIDAQRKVLNRRAADIREAIKNKGEDTDAFKDVYAYFKKRRHERDGYDESHKVIFEALDVGETRDMFENLNKD